MDDDVVRFRRAAARENRGRRGLSGAIPEECSSRPPRIGGCGRSRATRCQTSRRRWASRRGVCGDGCTIRAFSRCRWWRTPRLCARGVVVVLDAGACVWKAWIRRRSRLLVRLR